MACHRNTRFFVEAQSDVMRHPPHSYERSQPLSTATKAVTISFLTLSLAQIFHLGNARSSTPVMSWRSVVRNRYALGAVALTIVLQALAVHLPTLAQILRTRPLTPGEWLVALGFAVVPAVVGQTSKMWRGRTPSRVVAKSG